MATIAQITSSTVTANVYPNTAYVLYASQSANTGFATTGISFTTPHGATTYSFTYTPTSGTYLSLSSSGANSKLYTDPAHGIVVSSRLTSLANVSSGTSFNINCFEPTTFYNLTSTTLTGFTITGPDPTQSGVYFVLRNNTPSTYLSLTRSSAASATITGIPNPLVIPPGTSANLVWNGAGYTMF